MINTYVKADYMAINKHSDYITMLLQHRISRKKLYCFYCSENAYIFIYKYVCSGFYLP